MLFNAFMATFAALSVFACIAVFRFKNLLKIDWRHPSNNISYGERHGRQRAVNGGEVGMAANASMALVEATTPATLMMGLMLVGALFGAIIGGAVVPAMFVTLVNINTLSMALMLVTAAAWALIFARLTLTALVVGVVLAIGALVLAAIGGVLYFMISFATGGDGIAIDNRLIPRLTSLDQTQWGRKVGWNATRNACVLGMSLTTMGNVQQVRDACEQSVPSGLSNLPRPSLAQGTPELNGTWKGHYECGGVARNIEIRLSNTKHSTYEGTLSFSGNPGAGIKPGKFSVNGDFDGGRRTLFGFAWIEPYPVPSGWQMMNLELTSIDAEHGRIRGKVLVNGCGALTLQRDGTDVSHHADTVPS